MQKSTGLATIAALALLTAPAAHAQQTSTPADNPASTSGADTMPPGPIAGQPAPPATQGIGDAGMADMTDSTAPGMPGGTGEDVEVLAELDDPEIASGSGRPSQAQLADVQTKLLNRFSQLGFGEVREFRREGESYVTEALSKDGDWVTVVLDPMSGTIVARR